ANSAASSSERTSLSLPFGRCNGVLVASFHTPCKSGSPHGVFGAGQAFAAGAGFGAGFVCVAGFDVCPAAGNEKAAMPAAKTAIENHIRYFIEHLLSVY